MNDVKYVELHGQRVAYREAGSGEVVMLIHGMAGSSDTWQAVVPQLARHYPVIAPARARSVRQAAHRLFAGRLRHRSA